MIEYDSEPKVTILMSTYNGECFIREQVDSLLAQQGVDIKINVRDDGSTDNTVALLREYNDKRIRIGKGRNLKPAQSFLKLLRECDESEYYAYCDQDDVWRERKLADAIEMLKRDDDGSPALYISTYDIVDSDLNYLFTFNMEFEKPMCLQDTIVHRAPSACTMVFNHALKEVLTRSKPDFVRMHDFWTLMVAEAFHYRIVTDSRPQLMYRQHGGNSVGITPSIFTRVRRIIHSAIHGKNERWRQAAELYKFYGDDMPGDSKEILECVLQYRRSLRNRLKLLNDKRFTHGSIYYDLLFKIAVFTGRF